MSLYNFEFEEKLIYTIDEIARRWKCDRELIIEYLIRSTLHAVIVLPKSQFNSYNDIEKYYINYVKNRVDDPFDNQGYDENLSEEEIIFEGKKIAAKVWQDKQSDKSLYIVQQEDVKKLFRDNSERITLDSVADGYHYLYGKENDYYTPWNRDFRAGENPTISQDGIYIVKSEADKLEIKYNIDVSEDNLLRQKRFEQKFLADDDEQLSNSTKKEHGNIRIFSAKREEILGAALKILSEWPNECKNKSGKIVATKLRKMIEEKALLFWPEIGEPPLKTEPIEKLLRTWLNKF